MRPSVSPTRHHPPKTRMQAYFRAVSDYAGCTQVKYEHAASTNASPEELSQLASAHSSGGALIYVLQLEGEALLEKVGGTGNYTTAPPLAEAPQRGVTTIPVAA